jgi:hypothetical protein
LTCSCDVFFGKYKQPKYILLSEKKHLAVDIINEFEFIYPTKRLLRTEQTTVSELNGI